MNLRSAFVAASLLLLGSTLVAGAESIASFTDKVGSTGTSQLGRPARYGLPQDWAGDEPYPDIAPGTDAFTYLIKTYTYAASDFTAAPYVEITFNDLTESSNVFLSAYGNSYDPSNRAANWLGDVGSDTDYLPGIANAFEVIVPSNSSLVLVVNTTDAADANNGSQAPYKITVDAYADASYDEPVVTPEPASFLLLGTGLAGVAFAIRRREWRQAV